MARRKKNHNLKFVSAYYLDKCYRDDPQVNSCLRDSANKLARYLQQGVPELGVEEVCLAIQLFGSILYFFFFYI